MCGLCLNCNLNVLTDVLFLAVPQQKQQGARQYSSSVVLTQAPLGLESGIKQIKPNMISKVTEYTEEASDDDEHEDDDDDNVSDGDFDIQYGSDNDDEKKAIDYKNNSNGNGNFVGDNDDMSDVAEDGGVMHIINDYSNSDDNINHSPSDNDSHSDSDSFDPQTRDKVMNDAANAMQLIQRASNEIENRRKIKMLRVDTSITSNDIDESSDTESSSKSSENENDYKNGKNKSDSGSGSDSNDNENDDESGSDENGSDDGLVFGSSSEDGDNKNNQSGNNNKDGMGNNSNIDDDDEKDYDTNDTESDAASSYGGIDHNFIDDLMDEKGQQVKQSTSKMNENEDENNESSSSEIGNGEDVRQNDLNTQRDDVLELQMSRGSVNLLDKGVHTIGNRNRNGKGNKRSPPQPQAQSSNQLRKIIPYIPPIMTTIIPPNRPNSVNRNIANNIDSVCSNSPHNNDNFFKFNFDSFYKFLNIFDSIQKMQLRDWEFKLLFVYIVYWHNRDLSKSNEEIFLRCMSFCNQNRQTFKNSMNALNDSIQNTNIINMELIDSVNSNNNNHHHKSNDSLDNLINAKHRRHHHHQGSISDNNDIMMQANRGTRQTSHSCFAKTDEEGDFYEKENQYINGNGNKNRNRNRYHDNNHIHKQRRKRIKKSMEHRKSQSLKFQNEKSWHGGNRRQKSNGINEDEITRHALCVAANQFIDECNNLDVGSRLHAAFATQIISPDGIDFDLNDDIPTNTTNDSNYTNDDSVLIHSGCTAESGSLSLSTGDSKGCKIQAITPDVIPKNRFNINKKQPGETESNSNSNNRRFRAKTNVDSDTDYPSCIEYSPDNGNTDILNNPTKIAVMAAMVLNNNSTNGSGSINELFVKYSEILCYIFKDEQSGITLSKDILNNYKNEISHLNDTDCKYLQKLVIKGASMERQFFNIISLCADWTNSNDAYKRNKATSDLTVIKNVNYYETLELHVCAVIWEYCCQIGIRWIDDDSANIHDGYGGGYGGSSVAIISSLLRSKPTMKYKNYKPTKQTKHTTKSHNKQTRQKPLNTNKRSKGRKLNKDKPNRPTKHRRQRRYLLNSSQLDDIETTRNGENHYYNNDDDNQNEFKDFGNRTGRANTQTDRGAIKRRSSRKLNDTKSKSTRTTKKRFLNDTVALDKGRRDYTTSDTSEESDINTNQLNIIDGDIMENSNSNNNSSVNSKSTLPVPTIVDGNVIMSMSMSSVDSADLESFRLKLQNGKGNYSTNSNRSFTGNDTVDTSTSGFEDFFGMPIGEEFDIDNNPNIQNEHHNNHLNNGHLSINHIQGITNNSSGSSGSNSSASSNSDSNANSNCHSNNSTPDGTPSGHDKLQQFMQPQNVANNHNNNNNNNNYTRKRSNNIVLSPENINLNHNHNHNHNHSRSPNLNPNQRAYIAPINTNLANPHNGMLGLDLSRTNSIDNIMAALSASDRSIPTSTSVGATPSTAKETPAGASEYGDVDMNAFRNANNNDNDNGEEADDDEDDDETSMDSAVFAQATRTRKLRILSQSKSVEQVDWV